MREKRERDGERDECERDRKRERDGERTSEVAPSDGKVWTNSNRFKKTSFCCFKISCRLWEQGTVRGRSRKARLSEERERGTDLVEVAHVAVSIHQARIQHNRHAISFHCFLKLTELHICTRQVIISIAKSWL
jgi:hypothetical protein